MPHSLSMPQHSPGNIPTSPVSGSSSGQHQGSRAAPHAQQFPHAQQQLSFPHEMNALDRHRLLEQQQAALAAQVRTL
jgi:hypothetical protein